MSEKERLLGIYKSQIEAPAFPHEKYSFIELMRQNDTNTARAKRVPLPYAECFKIQKSP